MDFDGSLGHHSLVELASLSCTFLHPRCFCLAFYLPVTECSTNRRETKQSKTPRPINHQYGSTIVAIHCVLRAVLHIQDRALQYKSGCVARVARCLKEDWLTML